MDLELRGKVAAVAAASQGLGKAVAAELSREGALVSICGRRADILRAATEEIKRATGGDVHGIVADVARRQDADRFVEESARRFGGLDILVLNAGGPPTGAFESLSDTEWETAHDLTLMSAVRLVRKAIPFMRSRGGGRIVAMTSISVNQQLENLLLSHSHRMAVNGVTKGPPSRRRNPHTLPRREGGGRARSLGGSRYPPPQSGFDRQSHGTASLRDHAHGSRSRAGAAASRGVPRTSGPPRCRS